jgi:DNA-binding beta-propeller fold protein YncE
VFTGSFGSPGSGAGQLGEPVGVAVNEATGDVYVLDKGNNRVEIFNSTGSKFEGEFNGSGLGLGILGSGTLLNEGKAAGSGGLADEVPSGRFDEPVGIAVDNDPSSTSFGDVYVADARGNKYGAGSFEVARMVVDKFNASGEYLGQITTNPDGEPYSEDGFAYIYGVAVDAHGEVWVEEKNFGGSPEGAANYSSAIANVWVGFRSTKHDVSGSHPYTALAAPGFAVDARDDLYVHNTFEELGDTIVEFGASGEVIKPIGDEEVPNGVAVELSSNGVYVSHLTNVQRVDASGKSLESLTVPGGHGSGVAVDSATLTVYVTDSAAGVVDVYKPEAPGVPKVSAGSESIKDVTATSASFSAEVNPRSEPNEEATSYDFEYGPCVTPTTCSSSPYVDSTPVPEGILAPNYEPDVVSAHPQDLLAHTAYHMRLVAHNSHPGVAEGEELTFTTQASGGFVLPDGRQWELVSPPNKYGALIQAARFLSQASLTGDAITYYANAPIEAQPPGNYKSIVQALADRTATRWQSLNINAPHESAPGQRDLAEYPFFSQDLSLGLLRPAGAFLPSLSTEASEQTPFLRTDFTSGDPAHLCTSSCYKPLVTDAPGFENVPPGTIFGSEDQEGGECQRTTCGPEFVGASPDARHIVLNYKWAPLVEGAPLESLYEWAVGRLSVVSVLPDEAFATSGRLGTTLGSSPFVRNAVSVDGSRVVWSDPSHLYLRDMAKEKTIQLDEVQGGSGEGIVGPPIFQTASNNGSRVFFTDSQRLTKNATPHNGLPDLYECEIVEEAGELKCKLTDLIGGAGEPVGPMGVIAGVSEDGSYVYFVASGALPGVRANNQGETAIAGQPDLYMRHEGVISLIAVLSSHDSTDWAGVASGTVSALTARVSPDGHWFSFMSDRSLTDFDNRDAVSGRHDEEVFLYHAGENSSEGSLACASCDPTGGRPHGVLSEGVNGGGLGPAPYEFGQVAAALPGWTSPLYQSRYLSNNGRLFFDSYDALIPQDINSAEDAYQFEPSGVGGCSEVSATFVVASDGCVGLVSSGTSKEPSAFLDASASGGDVFFVTTAQLSPLDVDSALDIYDAHECRTDEVCSSPVSTPVPACEGDACQSPGAAPEDPTPGSLTYRGSGNPPAPLQSAKAKPRSKTVKCRKGAVKRRGRCVKAKAKKRAKRAKRTNRRGE